MCKKNFSLKLYQQKLKFAETRAPLETAKRKDVKNGISCTATNQPSPVTDLLGVKVVSALSSGSSVADGDRGSLLVVGDGCDPIVPEASGDFLVWKPSQY